MFKIIHGCTWGDAVCVDGSAKFASIMNVLTPYLRISCSARVTVPALNMDKLAAKLSGLRFAPRTRIGVRAGFGSPGSITSGSVMGGSGASPGFSIGGGAGSGTGGKSPGGTPGLGAGGEPAAHGRRRTFPKPKSFRYAPLTALSSRSRVMHPQTHSRLVGSAEPALPGHLQFLVLRLEVGQVCL